MGQANLTVMEHLSELRRRLFTIVVVILLGMIGSYTFIETIIEYVMKPASNLEFVYLAPPELFLAYIKISLVIGFVITSPITLLQIWLFLRPGLEKREKRYLILAIFVGSFFFALGAFFAYKVILPITIKFFVNIAIPEIDPMFSFGSYVSFISSIMLSFGLVFEMPMVVMILTKLNLLSAATLKKGRKMSILVIFVVAAFITPPDIISQVLLAGPMLLLFEFSIFLSKFVARKKEK